MSRMDRFYDELRNFLDGPEVSKTWDDVFRSDSKRIMNYLKRRDDELELEVKDVSRSKVRITIKKTCAAYVGTNNYVIISGDDEFNIVLKDEENGKKLRIPFESLRYDPALLSKESVIKKIENETSRFFEDVKVACHPYDAATNAMIMKIILFNKGEFDSCDRE